MSQDIEHQPADPSRIAYLGPSGTFTEQALVSQTDLAAAELVPYPKFVDVLDATSSGDTQMGFVAIENAIEGTVNITLDALAFDHELLIQREVVLDIQLDLVARPGTSIDDVTAVFSHPVANAQCRQFLHKEVPAAEVKAANSTSEAAVMAADDRTIAALAPALAADRYGLETLAADVADHPGNQTRFVLVAPSGVPARSGHDKTTVVLNQREDRPGSLVAILQEFAARSINLSRLSSRPVKTALGNYCFIVDIDGHIDDELLADCLRSIRAKLADIKFLGSYPAEGKGSTETRLEVTTAWAEADRWLDGIRSQIAR
ncbi:MAG: prephenate dehydratase [Actinomycetota bacterium]